MASLFYNQPGTSYDDPRFTWDGEIYIAPPDPAPNLDLDPTSPSVKRPYYWIGASSTTKKQKTPSQFTSLVIESQLLSINGYELETAKLDEIRFAGENDMDAEVIGCPDIHSEEDEELVLSCVPVTKSSEEPIITMEVVTNE